MSSDMFCHKFCAVNRFHYNSPPKVHTSAFANLPNFQRFKRSSQRDAVDSLAMESVPVSPNNRASKDDKRHSLVPFDSMETVGQFVQENLSKEIATTWLFEDPAGFRVNDLRVVISSTVPSYDADEE